MSVVIAAAVRGTPLGRALAAPDRLLDGSGSRFVKDHRRTAVAATTVEGREIFVKHFKPYAWYRRLEWMFTITPARRCWARSVELEAAGFRVAPPLALAETRRYGMPADCYFVTSGVAGAEPAGRFWRERAAGLPIRERRSLLVALARELRHFHDSGFYSRDANADNFLARRSAATDPEFFLLDLENVRRLRSVSPRRRAKNLVQLYRPIRGEVEVRDRLRFLRAYAREPLPSLRTWLATLEKLDAAKEAEYRARRREG